MELKKPFTLDEQIQRLRKHNMHIDDITLAKQILSEVNYYRFTGYALQFRDDNHPDDYIPGTSFEDVWRIHQFDTDLRCMLKHYIDVVELYARSQIAHGFSIRKCTVSPYDQHYEKSNFYRKDKHHNIIMSSLDKEKEHSRDSLFVKHHSDKYKGRMPLWVIVELISFTNLSKLYSAMYFSEQNFIAAGMGTTGATLINHLHCLANLRNKVAHAGRLYNAPYNPPVTLGRKYLQNNPDIETNTLFAYLIALIRRTPSKACKISLCNDLEAVIAKYMDCIQLRYLGFPCDYKKRLDNEIA